MKKSIYAKHLEKLNKEVEKVYARKTSKTKE